MKYAKSSLVISIIGMFMVIYGSLRKLNGNNNPELLELAIGLVVVAGIFLFISLAKENKNPNSILWIFAFLLFPGIANIIYYFYLRNKLSLYRITQ
ncbi:MAG TPA: hypothetical protein VLZ83_00555 [Edaphocola sp.]|nr:hypothetical protein [Edaphocola sp.]